MTDTSTACLGSSSKLPWELLLRIFELTAETSQISAANVAGVCQAGASIARTMLYKTLVISSVQPRTLSFLERTLRCNSTIARLVRTVIVDIPESRDHTLDTQGTLGNVVKTINEVVQVGDLHVIWANNQHSKALGHRIAPAALRSLLCRHIVLEAHYEWIAPSLTHLVVLHLGGVGRFSSPSVRCAALTHFACTIHHLNLTPTVFVLLVLPRLREVLDRAAHGLPNLQTWRLFVASSILREYGPRFERLADECGTGVRFVELPDEMDDAAMHALAAGLSDAHFDGSLWESRDIVYRDVLRVETTPQ